MAAIFYKQTFPILIRDKERVLYNGQALSLTTWNSKGIMDVLPGHSHLVSIIEKQLDIIKNDGNTLSVPVTKAILKVFQGEVRVYLGVFSSLSAKK